MYQHTLIILDWDDTLFPTTWTINNGIDLSNNLTKNDHQLMFAELDNIIYDFLVKTIKLGKVIIITNASYNWIRLAMSVVPNTTMLIDKYIKIISARDLYQDPSNMTLWKLWAFEKEVMKYFSGNKILHNIISIGDADYEFNALTSLYHWNKIIPKYKYLKTIKFMTAPSYHSLIDQLNVLSLCITKIRNRKTHMDLRSQNLK